MPTDKITLDAGDVMELGQLLAFLDGWFTAPTTTRWLRRCAASSE